MANIPQGPNGSAQATTATSQTPYDYGTLKDRYDQLSDAHPEIAKMGMGDFYKTLNEQSKTNLFDQGTNPGFIKNASHDVDKFMNATGLPQVAGDVVGSATGVFGPDAEEAGRRFGEGVPRVLAAGALGSLIGPEGTFAGLTSAGVGMGTSGAASTYEATNSPLAALANGAVASFMPGMGHLGGELAAKYLGTKVGSELTDDGIRQSLPGAINTLKEMAVERIGQEVGLNVNQELQRQATNVALGQGLSMPSQQDVIGDLVGTLAPMGLDVVHTALHGVPGADGNFRSQSEMMNVADAARQIATKTLASDVSAATQAVDTTYKATNDADAQRALAVRDPFTLAVNPVTEADARPDLTVVRQDPDTTALGVPLQDRGLLRRVDPTVDTAAGQTTIDTNARQTLSLPEEPAIDVEFHKMAEPHYAALPDRTEQPQEGGDEKPAEAPKQLTGPVTTLSLPQPLREEVTKVPPTVTPESLAQTAKIVPTRVVTVADFHDLSDLHTNLMRQLTDNPNLRSATGVTPVNDSWLQNHFKDAVLRGHTEAEAITTVGEIARQKTVADINKVNRHLLNEREATDQAALGTQAPEEHSDVEFVKQVSAKDPRLAQVISDGLKTKRGESLPFNTPAAIANWVRRTRMSDDTPTKTALGALKDVQESLGRKLNPGELRDFLGKQGLDAERIGDIEANHGEMFTRTGSVNRRGVFDKIVAGNWKSPLKDYLLRIAAREHEELTHHQSLDEAIHADGEESGTMGDLVSDGIAEARAREMHEDEASVATSKKMSEDRIQNVRRVSEAVRTMSDAEVTKIIAKAQIQPPAQLGRFKQRLVSYLEGVAMFPEARRGAGDGRGLGRDRGGLYTFLKKQQEWEAAKTTMATEVRKVEKFLAAAGLADSVEPKAHGTADEFVQQAMDYKSKRDTVTSLNEVNQRTQQGAPLDRALEHSTYGWFSNYYKNVGLPEGHPLFSRYVESATRLAHLYPHIDKVRVGNIMKEVNGLMSTGAGGIFHGAVGPDGQVHSFVGMLGETLKNSPLQFDAFIKNVILAHEFSHALDYEHAFGKADVELQEKYEQASDVAKSLTDDERAIVLKGMMEMIVPKELMSNPDSMRQIDHMINYGATSDGRLGNANPDEFMATFSSLLSIGMSNPATYSRGITDVKTFLTAIPDKLREFQQAFYTNLSEFSDGLRGYFNEQADGLGEKYVQMADIYKQLAKTPAQVEAAQRAFTEMQSMAPEEFLNRVSNSMADDAFVRSKGTQIQVGFLNDMKNLAGLKVTRAQASTYADMVNQAKDYFKPDLKKEGVYGKEPGLFWWATPLAQFAEKFPVLRPLADNLLGYEGMTRNGIALAFTPYGMKNVGGKLIKDGKLEALGSVAHSTGLRKAYSTMALWQNKNAAMATREDIMRETKVSAADADKVSHVLAQTAAAMEQVLGRGIKSSIETSQHMVGRLAMANDPTMSAQQGKEIGKEMVGAALMTKSSDPAMQQQGLQRGMALAQKYGPDKVSALYDLTDKLVTKHTEWAAQASARKWYSPETRPGDFGLSYTKDGKSGYQGFKTAEEAMKAHDAMSKQSGYQDLELINPYSKTSATSRVKEANVNHFIDLEQQWQSVLKEKFADQPEVMQALSQLNPGQEALHELATQGVRANFQHRAFSEGRETIDMLQNSMNYVQAMMRANAKTYIRSHSMILGADPSLRNEPRLMKIFNDHQEAVLNPPATATKWLNNMAALYYVGLNPSSALITALQPLQATLPHLTRTGTGILGGLKYMKDATGTIINHFALKKPLNDAMLSRALDKAVADRVVNFSIMSESHFGDDAWQQNVKNLGNASGDISDGKVLARNTGYQALRIAQSLMMGVTQHNHRVALIAGFNAARDEGKRQGLQGEELFSHAYDQAKRTVEVSMHSGGAASRPVGFGQTGKLYGIASNLYVLNHFATSMMSIMSRLGNEALGRSGLVGGELTNARKAFVTAMGTQFLLAGALGMPFASAGVAMLEKMFPDLQLNRDIREFFASFGGDDAKMGSMIADSALNGLGTSLSPYDISGRLGMGSVLGADSYFGFNAEDLLGATGSMLTNMVHGVQGATSGDWKKAQQFLPEELQHAVNAINDNGSVRGPEGQLKYQPTDTQRTMMAFGFRPKDLSHAQEQSMIEKRTQEIENRELQKFYSEQEGKLAAGKFDEVRQALYQRAAADKSFSPLVGLRRIVEGYQKSVNVADPSAQGKLSQADDNARLARSFGNQAPATPSHTNQLFQRVQLEQAVGVPGAGHVTPQALSQAQTVDYLQTSYGLTDAQARDMFNRMTKHGNTTGSQ